MAAEDHESLEEHMQLQRVFRILTIDVPDKRLARKLQVVEAKLAELYHASLSDSVVDAKTRDRHHREGKRLEECKAAYLAERHKLHAGGQDDWLATHRISKDVLVEVLERLGMPVSAAEVEDMVWEVNDGLDGAVSWDEYKRSFLRCKHDKTCLEPTLLFHITCFVMYDRDCSGKVSMDDAMHMLFLKYGNHMEAEMEALFGKRLRDDEFVMTLTFPQYVEALERRRIDQIDQLGVWGKLGAAKRHAKATATLSTPVKPPV
ncbi:hypothetical protein AaE_008438 [Aphanomyces astaci]|uniref:EF-hand domain-containing protein n=1 Tax=Aphanomyces astaci TaxID=112090 RepID=A0A6A5ADF2_APHAT|nr:hypothetical protein AaE_008438 [Aphanomyces astaci]